MGVIHTENWDGVTAPAIPSSWNVDSVYTTTSSPTSPISPISSPNVLKHAGASNADHYATWNTQDGNSGNVTVSAYCVCDSITSHTVYGVTARGSASSLNSSSTSQYRGYYDLAAGQGVIDGYHAGSLFSVATGAATGALAANDWYAVNLSLSGSSLALTIQRSSDGFWLNSSGAFQSATATYLSATDSTISGQGYSGIYSVQHSSNVFSDNWSISTYASAATASAAIAGHGDTFAGSAVGGATLETAVGAIHGHGDTFNGIAGGTPPTATGAITGNRDVFAGSAGIPSLASATLQGRKDVFAGSASTNPPNPAVVGIINDGIDLFKGAANPATTNANASGALNGGRDQVDGQEYTEVFASAKL